MDGREQLNDDNVEEIAKEWYERAKKIANPGQLSAFVGDLITKYTHSYSSIVEACAAAAIAGAYTMEHSPEGGITGFQGSWVMWRFIKEWMHKEGPLQLLEYEWLIYPQHKERFTTITKETWEWVQKEAQKRLSKHSKMCTAVRTHMENIVAGIVPFGLQIRGE